MALTTSIPGADSSEVAAGDRAAEALLTQSRNGGFSDKPGIDPARESALDEAFAAVPKTPEGEAEPGTENYGVKPEVEGTPKPKAEPTKPAEEVEKAPAAPEKKEDAPAPAEEQGRKSLLDDVIDKNKAPAPDPTQKAFDEVKLRSDASPKTQETFNNLKEIAKQQIAAQKAETEKVATEKIELTKKVEELQKQVGQDKPETQAELKELREFRALHDVSSRPEFKEKFDSKIEKNDSEIYTLFTQEGMKPESLAALKALSPNERADYIEKEILPNLTSGQRRVVEAKILDNVNILGEKSKALDAARTDADKIIAERRGEPEKQRVDGLKAMGAHLKPIIMSLPFFHPKEIPSTATDTEKKEIEATNKWALELQQTMRNAATDTSPEARAEAILAVPLAKHYRDQWKQATTRAETAEAELAAIKKASATGRRLGQSAAPANTQAPAAPKAQDGEDALDKLFKDATSSA